MYSKRKGMGQGESDVPLDSRRGITAATAVSHVR